jgi:hypothetical protein
MPLDAIAFTLWSFWFRIGRQPHVACHFGGGLFVMKKAFLGMHCIKHRPNGHDWRTAVLCFVFHLFTVCIRIQTMITFALVLLCVVRDTSV